MLQKTLVIIKPDAVRRGLTGEIIKRIEAKGLNIEDMKMMHIKRELAEKHYEEHKDKPFFESLVDFITSGKVVVMIVSGPEAVRIIRTMMGPTNPAEAPPGTIRGDFGIETQENIIHGSDSVKSAEREISLFFGHSSGNI